MISALLYAYGVFWLAAISPGPDFAITVKNSIQRGRGAGCLCALGVATANGIHISYIVLGLGALVTHSQWLYRGLQIAGAIYLIYLGMLSVRSKSRAQNDPIYSMGTELVEKDSAEVSRSPFVEGLLINILNPKAIVFWLSFFSIVFTVQVSWGIRLGFSILLIFSLFVWFSLVSFLFSQSTVRGRFLKNERAFNVTMGILLVLLGIKVFATTFHQ